MLIIQIIMTIKAKFLVSETRRCGYFEDGRMATMDYYGHDDLSKLRFEDDIPDQYRKTRFSLMRKGLLGDAFSAGATDCASCNACVPLRINTFEFEPTTRQRKIMEKFVDSGGEAIWMKPVAVPPLYDLHRKFLTSRFPNSPMLADEREDFYASLHSKSNMMLLTNGRNDLLGYASIDRFERECSLDYIAYDPDHSDLRLGNVSFLATVHWAQSNLIPHVYIGPTNESASLRYKRYYSGLETFDGENWVAYDPKKHTRGPNYDKIVQRFGI